MTIKRFAFAIFVAIATTSCSGTYHAYYDTLKIAFSEPKDADMTLAQVAESKIDLMSVQRGERPKAIMALAYLENGRHKWVSADNAMFVMEQGRVVRTLGLNKDLLYLGNSQEDPLKRITSNAKANSSAKQSNQWRYITDWSGDEYGHPIESHFTAPENETLTLLSKPIHTYHYVETLSYQAPSDYLRFNQSWQNHYWFDQQSGALVKSIQTLSPISEPVEFVYLSRIARLAH
ncbi:MAG: YjbF family lipoprotein [Paraglaciecola chathamensis]